ncbi:MAG: hypothetical protein WCL27_08490 [Betaproteobacteria bacterium]
MNEINRIIIEEITNTIHDVNLTREKPQFGDPIIRFADAANPMFTELKTLVHPGHFTPYDLMPDAKTVIAYFVPAHEDIAIGNQVETWATKEWSLQKGYTKTLMDEITARVQKRLAAINVNCSGNSESEIPFDTTKFTHPWSLKAVAYIAGVGRFGLNQLIITEKGCAGRLGSFVINAAADYNKTIEEEYCLYRIDGSCHACVDRCPADAYDPNRWGGLDKQKCKAKSKEQKEIYKDVPGATEACAKCQAPQCFMQIPQR